MGIWRGGLGRCFDSGGLGLIEKKRIGEIDAYKSYIPRMSSLVGKTAGEIIREYNGKIIFNRISNSLLEVEAGQEIDPKLVFECGMGIKLFGDWKDICEFTTKYGLP